MRRRSRGLTLGEVMMSLALMATVLATALVILNWALWGSRGQQAKTTAAFLAQRQLEAILEEEVPRSGAGSFEAPFDRYRWQSRVEELKNEPFLAVEVTVSGAGGVSYRLYTERCARRRALVYSADNKLWRSHEDLHDEEMLLSDFQASEYTLSPDGKTLAYVEMLDGKPQIFTRSLPEGSGSVLFIHPQGAREPRFSPDGSSLAFTSIDDGHSQVFVYQMAEKTWVNRSRPGHHDGSPAWTADGKGLVVCRDGQALVLLQEGSETVLEENEDGWNATPDVSPDGKTLVFMSSREAGNPEIYVMDLATRQSTRLTDHPGYDTQPHFSQDGKRIVFSRRAGEDGISQLYSMNPDGSGVTPLTAAKGGEEPCWSL